MKTEKKTAVEILNEINENNRKFSETIGTLNPVLQMQQKVSDTFSATHKMRDEFNHLRQLTQPMNDLYKAMEKFKLPKSPWEEFAQLQRNIIIGFENYQRETPENLIKLSQYGWFLGMDVDMEAPRDLAELIDLKDIKAVDDYFISYFEENLESIFNELSKVFPGRQEIFSQILSAHRAELYFLSIPAVFSQIDGVCMELTQKKFFVKITAKNDEYRYKPEIVHALENINSSILKAFVAPVFTNSPLNVMEKDVNQYPVFLNRHAILHGVDVNYGNKINSLKCLSLLKYLSDILFSVLDDQKNEL